MKYTNIFLTLIIIFRFLISVVGGSLAGIGAELVSVAFYSMFLVMLARQSKSANTATQQPGVRENVFATLSFSGILLATFPVRFIIGAFIPELALSSGYFQRFGDTSPLLHLLAFVLGCVALITTVWAVLRLTVTQTARQRMIIVGLVFPLISLSLQSAVSDLVFGCFLALYVIRYASYMIATVYTVMYRTLWLALEYFEYKTGHTYGQMMGWLQITGMLSLFSGIALLFSYLEQRLLHKKNSSRIMAVIVICASVLLIVIGCAVIQYSNR